VIIEILETGHVQKAPNVSIFGQQLSRYNFYLTPEYLMFRIHFHPGALYRLLGIPLSEFTGQYFDVRLLINPEIQEVSERLDDCKGFDNVISIVENYLVAKIKKVKKEPHELDLVASQILNNPSRFLLDSLARQTCLCPRQFNRKFKERMGISPKLYSRIVRFYHAYQYKQKHTAEDWLSVAVLFGYSDYQHLAKEFKEFAQVTPCLWIAEDDQSPERILHLE
jgi:AraC-like DNA-binding protein